MNTRFVVNDRIRVLQSIIESCLKIRFLQSMIEYLFEVNHRLLTTWNKNLFRNHVTRRVLQSITFFTVVFCSKWNHVSCSRFCSKWNHSNGRALTLTPLPHSQYLPVWHLPPNLKVFVLPPGWLRGRRSKQPIKTRVKSIILFPGSSATPRSPCRENCSISVI